MWLKATDDYLRQPWLAPADSTGRLVYFAGQLYCARFLTDGDIPAGALPQIAADCALGTTKVRRIAGQLIDAGIWQARDGGYFDPRYLEHQPTKAQKLAENAKEADRKRAKRQPSDQEWIGAMSGPDSGDPSTSTSPRSSASEDSPSGDVSPTGYFGSSSDAKIDVGDPDWATELRRRKGEASGDYIERLRQMWDWGTLDPDSNNGDERHFRDQQVRIAYRLVNEMFGTRFQIDAGRLAALCKECRWSWKKLHDSLVRAQNRGNPDPVMGALNVARGWNKTATGQSCPGAEMSDEEWQREYGSSNQIALNLQRRLSGQSCPSRDLTDDELARAYEDCNQIPLSQRKAAA